MKKPMIRARKIAKVYNGVTKAVDGVDLDVRRGEWVTIMGHSGSGKTTLLNMLSCLDRPTSGRIIVDGENIVELAQSELTAFRRLNIGLVFQQHHLVPYLTALENVMLAQHYAGGADEESAAEALRSVGLGKVLDHLPMHMSGGEQQRACIARALINEPKIVFADEPTGNLDRANGEVVLELIRKLHEKGRTIVLVTHNEEIARLGDRVVVMVDGKISSDSKSSVFTAMHCRAA